MSPPRTENRQQSCPTCGAKKSVLIAACAYCGVEVTHDRELGREEYLQALVASIDNKVRERLGPDADEFDRQDARVEAIRELPIPSETQTCAAFLFFCHSNVSPSYEAEDESDAWKGKAKAAYDSLRLATLNDPQIGRFLEDYRSIYSADALKKHERSKASHTLLYTLLSVMGIIVVYGGGYFIIKGLFFTK